MTRRAKKENLVFAKILTTLMHDFKLSNRDAARVAQVSQTSIHDWKNGVTPSDFQALMRLADHFSVTLRFLLTGNPEPSLRTSDASSKYLLLDGGELFSGICEVKIRKLLRQESIPELTDNVS